MEFLEFKELYNKLSNRYIQICKYLDLDAINKKLDKLKSITLNEDFWLNKNEATATLKAISLESTSWYDPSNNVTCTSITG